MQCCLTLLQGARCRSLAHTLALMGAEHELPVMLYGGWRRYA